MCTVSVLLEAQRNWESMLNTRELMFTYLEQGQHCHSHSHPLKGNCWVCLTEECLGRKETHPWYHSAQLLLSLWVH